MSESTEAKLHFLDYWQIIRSRIWLILLTFFTVVIAAVVVTMLMPRQYGSRVVLQVQQTNPTMSLWGGASSGAGMDAVSPGFSQLQFEIIQHKEVLYPVIEELNLTQRWAADNQRLTPAQAYGKLRGMMDVSAVRGTSLISIDVWSTDAREAAQLANYIAAAYEDRRVSYYGQIKAGALRQLQAELELQENKVIEARRRLDTTSIELGIIDVSSERAGDIADPSASRQMSIEAEIGELESNISTLRNQLNSIQNWNDDDFIRSLEILQVPNSIVERTLPLYQDTRSGLIAARADGLGSGHPRVKSLNESMEQHQETLMKQVEVIKEAMQIRLRILTDNLRNAELKKEELAEEIRNDKATNVAYVRAKNDYQQELQILLAAKQRYTTEAMQTAIPFVPMIIHEKAEESSNPGKPNFRLNLALGVGVGIVFSLFLAFFIEYLDTSVKSLEDVENALEVPVLGVIPKGIQVLSSQSSDTPDAEAYRIIRTNIEFNRRSSEENAITVISGGAGEGKSTTLFNLAYTFAQGGYNVLVVDADLRRPSQHHFFNVDNSVGLTDYLTSDLSLEDVIVRTSLDNLSFLASGHLPKDAVGILNSQRMSDLITELKGHFDLVFFDSPPILGVSDAAVLSSEVDLTIMVVQHRRFPKAMLQRVKNSVLNVGGTLLGVVLNNVDIKNDKSYDYYTAYYDYYYSKKSNKDRGANKLKGQQKQLAKSSVGQNVPDSNDDQY